MKKIKLLAALLALTIGLAGCGKGSNSSSSSASKNMLDGDNMTASSTQKQEYEEPEDVMYMRLLAGEDEYHACVLYLGGSYEVTTDVQKVLDSQTDLRDLRCSSACPMRARSSAAAALVKVTMSSRSALTGCSGSVISCTARSVSTAVFPLPAAALTSSAPPRSAMAACCAGVHLGPLTAVPPLLRFLPQVQRALQGLPAHARAARSRGSR